MPLRRTQVRRVLAPECAGDGVRARESGPGAHGTVAEGERGELHEGEAGEERRDRLPEGGAYAEAQLEGSEARGAGRVAAKS